MAFFSIHPAEGLTPSQRRRASRDGPVAVATARPHRDLLGAAGFGQVSERDCTAEFAATTNAWIEESERFRDDLAAVIGEKAVEERQADRRAQLAAVGAGVLRRSLFRAVRP